MAFKLNINGRSHSLDIEPETPLLWVLRDTIGLTGTKYGCGISACGACTVHVNGRAVRSCVTPASTVIGKKITTIEGLPLRVPRAFDVAGALLERCHRAFKPPPALVAAL